MVDHHTHPEHHARRRSRRRGGFTLIELLVVIGLIAVLLALVLSGLNRATKTARRAASQRSAAAMAQAVDLFKKEFGFFPPLVHDGMPISNGDPIYQPLDIDQVTALGDGPIRRVDVNGVPIDFILVWNEGVDFNFFRARNEYRPTESQRAWDIDEAWNDRRYSKYALAYYLTGVLDKDIDGVRGPGFARPQVDGTFYGVGYLGGSVRDRYEPFMEVERRGARINADYVEPREISEHDAGADPVDLPSYADVRSGYEPYQQSALFAIVDSFGNAFRYYRWEQGRYENGRLVVENELDLNIPPVLIDPVLYERVRNDPSRLQDLNDGLLSDNAQLRNARYAIVSAGPDGLFGTERIETIAQFLSAEVPTDNEEVAQMRREVWADNAVEVGS